MKDWIRRKISVLKRFSTLNPVYCPHPYLVYHLKPNYVSQDGLTHHNTSGFRGGDFESKKSAGRYRIVCMGESTTYCTGIRDDRLTYPGRLPAHLREIYPDVDLEVLNAGVPSYCSAENLLLFIFKVQPVQPDLIVYYYTHNDVHARRFPDLNRDYTGYTKIWEGENWLERVRRWVHVFFPQARGIQGFKDIGSLTRRWNESEPSGARILENPPDYFRDNMENLAMLARGWNIDMLFVNPAYPLLGSSIPPEELPVVCQAMRQHREIVRHISRKHGHPLLDLNEVWPYPAGQWTSPYHWDKVHFNEDGADRMAELVAGSIRDIGFLEPFAHRLRGLQAAAC